MLMPDWSEQSWDAARLTLIAAAEGDPDAREDVAGIARALGLDPKTSLARVRQELADRRALLPAPVIVPSGGEE
jgi:hypothetical protein